jgi:hypothetical protein
VLRVEDVWAALVECTGDEPWLLPTPCWFCPNPAERGLNHTSGSGNRVDVCRRHREDGLALIEREWDTVLLREYLLPLRVAPLWRRERILPRREQLGPAG